MEQMELNRLTEMEKFIQIYAQTMQVMAESLQQVGDWVKCTDHLERSSHRFLMICLQSEFHRRMI